MENISIRNANESDMERILFYINEFSLDGENAKLEEFVVAELNGDFAGFGRIKSYGQIYELSSIGVLKEYRHRGVGETMVKHIIDIFPSNEVWITTIIPDFFKKIGFKIHSCPPDEIKQKRHRICKFYDGNHRNSKFMLYKKTSRC